jgi:hypothetical protein
LRAASFVSPHGAFQVLHVYEDTTHESYPDQVYFEDGEFVLLVGIYVEGVPVRGAA